MEIKYYLRTLLHGWWLILLTMLIAVQVTLTVDYFATPIYRASASFAISPNTSQMVSSSDVLYSLDTLDNRSVVNTYAEFLNSNRIYTETLASLNLDPELLKDYTRTTVVITDSNVLELTVEGTDPNTVAILANRVGEHAVSAIQELYNAYDISLLDPAEPSKIPVRPVPLRDAALALALGLIVGCALAVLRAQIQSSLDTVRQKSNLDKSSQAFTHQYLVRRLEQEFVRYPDGELSFGLIQLDGLRSVFEGLPQNMVQDLMRLVTQTFKKELRGNDLIARWDDITFAILLPSTSGNAAQRTITRLCGTLAQPVYLREYGQRINLQPLMSVTTSEVGENSAQIIARAQDMLKHIVDLENTAETNVEPENGSNG